MSLDEWIDGAKRTERAVTLYQRADLIADLDDLDRRITLARAAGDDIGDLVDQWQATAQRFAVSALTVRVRGLTGAEIKALQATAMLDRLELDEVGAQVIAAACIDPVITPTQVRSLIDAVGEAQVVKLGAAVVAACNEAPEVPTDG